MRKDLAGLSPEEKKKLAAELMADAAKPVVEYPSWFDGKKVDEVAYCEQLLAQQEMRCINNRIYSMDGLIDDEKMKAQIAEDLKPYVRTYLYKTADRFLQTIKVLCVSDPIKPTADKIHFLNGTYSLDGSFTAEKEWTMNRIPVEYDPDAPNPERWLKFLSELLDEDDILTLQEYLGYCLTATNRGQSMLLIIGKGGEGKSRISAVMQEMFGANLNMGNINKLESDKFNAANLEYKLLFIDDDIKMEALGSTNMIKTIVTCEGTMELERKRMQPFQGIVYARLLCLGNGTLKALHDKSMGFYRRQIIIQTKNKPVNRVDDPYLKDKLIKEIPGILFWCVEGLMRLVKNNYKFTISDKSKNLKAQHMEDDNSVKAFFESEGYIEFKPDEKCSTLVLYKVYSRWCHDNAIKPSATATFTQYLSDNETELNLVRTKNVTIGPNKRVRGYKGICVADSLGTDFITLPDDYPTPFDD